MEIHQTILNNVIEKGLERGADFVEVFIDNTHRKNFSYLGKKPEKAISGITSGAGLRFFVGTEQFYTFTNDLTESGLLRAVDQATRAFPSQKRELPLIPPSSGTEFFGTDLSGSKALPTDPRWKGLEAMDQAARQFSSLITQVHAEVSEVIKHIHIVNSEGVNRAESRCYLNAFTRVFAEDQGANEMGYERTSFIGSADDWQKIDFQKMATDAAAQSLRILKAEWAPAGEMPVLLDSGFGGVIFHEACGHGLETTSVAKEASVFCGKLGERVAHESVTAIDDGTLLGENGSFEIDDEGEPSRRTVLIEKGILKSYIVDKMGARKTGFAITGSGRRQDYRFAPTSRMRNTFIAAGSSSFEEMIRDIDYGLYAKNLGGGSVNPGTGSYNFAVNEGFIVRNGKIAQQVKGASLIGTGIETLGRVIKVGQELKLAPGTCGSVSGMIPVTVGQPPLLVSKLTVGGKAGS